jgi:hypothetical protein
MIRYELRLLMTYNLELLTYNIYLPINFILFQ